VSATFACTCSVETKTVRLARQFRDAAVVETAPVGKPGAFRQSRGHLDIAAGQVDAGDVAATFHRTVTRGSADAATGIRNVHADSDAGAPAGRVEVADMKFIHRGRSEGAGLSISFPAAARARRLESSRVFRL
jgi:hypothetical protein